jgi:hypothetical protein
VSLGCSGLDVGATVSRESRWRIGLRDRNPPRPWSEPVHISARRLRSPAARPRGPNTACCPVIRLTSRPQGELRRLPSPRLSGWSRRRRSGVPERQPLSVERNTNAVRMADAPAHGGDPLLVLEDARLPIRRTLSLVARPRPSDPRGRARIGSSRRSARRSGCPKLISSKANRSAESDHGRRPSSSRRPMWRVASRPTVAAIPSERGEDTIHMAPDRPHHSSSYKRLINTPMVIGAALVGAASAFVALSVLPSGGGVAPSRTTTRPEHLSTVVRYNATATHSSSSRSRTRTRQSGRSPSSGQMAPGSLTNGCRIPPRSANPSSR